MADIEIPAKFWAKVERREESECWPWMGGRDERGYGIFYTEGRKQRAHRWLLGKLRGTPLVGQQTGIEDACHRCDNPPCVNPAHLYIGTRKRNVADAVERSRLWQQQVTHCPQGHPYDEANTAIRPTGARRCRACAREQDRRRRGGRTTCHKGHELSGDNILLCRNGTRKCRICDRARNDARKPKH